MKHEETSDLFYFELEDSGFTVDELDEDDEEEEVYDDFWGRE